MRDQRTKVSGHISGDAIDNDGDDCGEVNGHVSGDDMSTNEYGYLGDDSDRASGDDIETDDNEYGDELNLNDNGKNNTNEEPIYISSDDEMMTTDLAVPDERAVTEKNYSDYYQDDKIYK